MFAEIIFEFPNDEGYKVEDDSFPNEYIFLISTSDLWYGVILFYLQSLKCPATFSREDRRWIRNNVKNYLIIGDTCCSQEYFIIANDTYYRLLKQV